ncbi:PstS family phosphate ABC transporter substrate-binding protein [Streptomyces sp. NPDC020917]|uniref:PstS family phosphate ABC transporter substrate-binding protein n=1 Tax=Streptomyces sp. NPDC020917 TaxID=3365102 RepID=UPI0037AA9ECD
MRPVLRVAATLAVSCALVATATASSMAGSDNSADHLATWAIAPQKPVVPQTDEQDAYNQANGRPLPTPELLQPTLDPGLRSYQAKPKNSLHGDYQCGASDVLAALSKSWIKEFEKLYPKVHIAVNPPYAGSLGALELIKGNLDCVFVSRELKPTDIQGFHDAFGYDPLSVPISGGSYRHFGFLDSVGVVVNKANPLDKLSFDQLDAALSTTRNRGGKAALTWGDLGATGEWADKPIHIVGLQPWNGFEEFVRQRVLDAGGKRGEWRPGAPAGSTPADPAVHWEKTVFNIAKDVRDDPYAIGYTGMAYVDPGREDPVPERPHRRPGLCAHLRERRLGRLPAEPGHLLQREQGARQAARPGHGGADAVHPQQAGAASGRRPAGVPAAAVRPGGRRRRAAGHRPLTRPGS